MSNKKNTQKLGKGLDILFAGQINTPNTLSYTNESVVQLDVDSIIPNPNQPRKQFEAASLRELAVSIKEFGILQPLVVVKKEQNNYSIIAGERRWRAAKIAKLRTVPAIIRTASELEKLELALIENVQREDLTPLDQALSIERLHDQFSMSYEDIASKLGKAYSTVANIVRLLQLPSDMQQSLQDKVISEGHARALLSLQKKPDLQRELFSLIQQQHLSVRQAEQFVVGSRSQQAPDSSRNVPIKRTQSTNSDTKLISKALHLPVSVHYMAKGGRLQIRFHSDEEYQELVEALKKLRK